MTAPEGTGQPRPARRPVETLPAATINEQAQRPARRTARRQAPINSRFLEAALGYADLGLRLVPLREKSKKPRQRGWPGKATVDPRLIKGWPRKWRDGNLGIATGGGIIAVDVDPRNGGDKSFKRLIAEHGPFPPTAEALTGTGGRHFLFRIPADRPIGCRNTWRPGIDIKGEGGYIVVEPSVHPKSGKEYVWLRLPRHCIADAPPWLIQELAGRPDRHPDEESPTMPGRWRSGDAQGLPRETVARFPISEPGHRHNQMTRAVGSLVGREYDDGLITDVLTAWWGHFHALGRTRTGQRGMAGELEACIRSTRRNPNFALAKGDRWHRARCQQIKLDARQQRLLRSLLEPGDAGAGLRIAEESTKHSTAHTPCKSMTCIDSRLCETEDERHYVEALIVQATHKRIDLGEVEIKMTDEQIRQIARDRRMEGWRPWDCQQMDRLKRKYLCRPGRPATRLELMRMTQEGRPRRGRQPGLPSHYQATGIEGLLSPEARWTSSDAICPAA
jgi:hypothetical protein